MQFYVQGPLYTIICNLIIQVQVQPYEYAYIASIICLKCGEGIHTFPPLNHITNHQLVGYNLSRTLGKNWFP